MGSPSKGILGKRRFPTADLDQNNQTKSSSDSGENPKPNKRVRFADIEDIPTSHVRTPIHHLVCQFPVNVVVFEIFHLSYIHPEFKTGFR